MENARDVSKMTIAANVGIVRIKPSLVGKIGFDKNVYIGDASWTLIVDVVKITKGTRDKREATWRQDTKLVRVPKIDPSIQLSG